MNNSSPQTPRDADIKVSVIVPVFNAGEYLLEAVESILANQCVGLHLEILLVDDRSTEPHTLELLNKYAKDHRFRIIRQAQNGGPAKARNTGIRAATGDWITFLDADDLMAPGIMEFRLQTIAQLPRIEWMAGDMLEMQRRDELTYTNMYPELTSGSHEIIDNIIHYTNATEKLILPYPPLFGSMIIKRELFNKTGLLDEHLIIGEDLLFSLITSCYTDLYWCKKPTFYLRRHHESLTKNKLKMARLAYKADLKALRDPRLRRFHKEIRWRLASMLRSATDTFITHNNYLNAIKSSLLSIFFVPNDTRNISSLTKAIRHMFKIESP